MNSTTRKSRDIEDIYPLSPMQEGMLFHSLLEPESGVYIEQMSALIEGDLDITSFSQAWQAAINRHSILRSSFIWEEVEKPLQVVYRECETQIRQDDWSELNYSLQEERLRTFLEMDRKTPFSFDDPPLMRFFLIRLGENRYRFVWSSHHILFDGWSLPILMKEVLFLYDAFHAGTQPRLSPVRNYRDYISWLQNQKMEDAKAYWQKLLSDFDEPTPIVVNSIPAIQRSVENGHQLIKKNVPLELSDRLRSYAQINGVTLNTIFQAAWGILLQLYSGKNDILFGATVSGRSPDLPGSDSMVGLFINTIPIRMQFPDNQSFVEWLKDLQMQNIRSRQFEYTPLVQIQSWSPVSQHIPLFDSILVFENFPLEPALQEQRGSLSLRDIRHSAATNYPLTIIGGPGKEFEVQISYDSAQIEKESAIRLIDQLSLVIARIPEINPTLPVRSVAEFIFANDMSSLLIGEENDQISSLKNIIQLIDQQAENIPQSTAIIFENEEINYLSLRNLTNYISNYLHQLNLDNNAKIGVSLKKSTGLILTLLGILKAGYSYVPIDPELPEERIAFIIEDSQLEFIITEPSLEASFKKYLIRVSAIDQVMSGYDQEHQYPSLICLEEIENAYVIYTSGTTGTPKGVLVGHKQLINHATAMAKNFGISVGTRMLQFISISFDASAEEIYPTFIGGGTLVIPPVNFEPTARDILDCCKKYGINILHLPAPVWHQMVNDLERDQIEISASIQLLAIGGEKLLREKLISWNKSLRQPMKFVNLYGPTETTITALMYPFDSDQQVLHRMKEIPIGKPIASVQACIVTNESQICPVGVPGELLIGGKGLAEGYLNQPELTNHKFIFLKNGQRWYKTGDRVVYLEDGNVYFIGRTDDQIKWRGYRIELGEIENAIRRIEFVQDVVVIFQDPKVGEKKLIAYLVLKDNANNDDEHLIRDALRAKLPEFMIPSMFVVLDKIPLTVTGKVNRQALPGLNEVRSTAKRELQRPRNVTEEIVCGMVEDILGLDQVGINENFFDLGGHSLLATQLVSRIRMDFKVDFPLRKLFDHPLIFEIAREIENLKEVFPEFIQSDLVKIPRNNDLPLSFSQQRLWFIDQLDPGTSAFNIPTTVRLKGNLDIESLKKSLSFLSERHEILRTVFPSKDGKPIQKIIPEPNYEFAFHDLEKETASAKENLALEWLQKEGKRSFDLVSGPLIRLSIARISTTEHILLLTLHHIITDGWSMNVLVKELAEIYTSYINGTEPKLEELPVQYADYAFWQRNWFSGRIYEEQIAYWKEQLAGIPQLLEIPTDKPRPAVKTSNGSHRSFNFSLEKTRFIKEFCRKEGLTLYMFLLGVFSVLLYRYSGQDDVCVGTAVANRTRPEIEELIGFFVNNLVLRTDLSGDPSFRELATRIREMTLNAYAHQDLPFEILVDELQPQRNMSYTPLFQVGFDVQSPKLGDLKFAGLSVLPVQIESGQAPYDLLLSLTDTSEGIIGQFEYNTDLFNPDTIDRMILNLTRLLDEAIRDPDTPVSYLPILSEQERKKILYEWNATAQDTDFNHCIQERFEYWVKKQPDHPALYFEGKTYSYLEVNKKANQLARFLRKVGIGPEKIVGILAERSFETILGIMAVLKAGGAYLPLDPNYPLDRIQYMMQDASQSQQESSIFLLTQGKMIERFSLDRSRVFVFDEDWEKVAGLDDKDLPLLGKPDNLAYVIYTSGSTGKPKGTLLIHRGLCNLSEVQKQIFEISPHSKVLQFSPLSFDASVWETFMALGNGATLYLARQEILSSGLDLLRFIKDEKITTVTLPPSLLAVLPYEDLLFLKTIIAAGEACSKEIVEKWSGGRLFFNAYGPTETTVCASVARCDKDDPLSPSIGRPLPNFQLYIVDKNLKPTPVGVPGELLIGGVGVARGYLNQQQLTAEKFIFNPFSPGGRLYRTGDLVRYRTDGNVEFLGRIDQQVKVRGFRIELGEIENVIRQVPEVGDAIVIVREDKQGDRRLAGYLVPKSGFSEADIRIQDIKDSLRQKLPDYMVPAYLIVLPSFPITPSGKIDRKSLPQPDIQTFDLQTVFVAPRTSVEASLCQLCEELLSVENVGINHNFFEMGGHSLLATQFTSRIRDKFGVELPLRILFEHPTIAELAVEIEKLSQSSRDASISTMKVVSREARKMKRNDLESKD